MPRTLNLGQVQSVNLNEIPGRRQITSCWHLTVNSNKQVRPDDPAYNEKIRGALRDAIQAPLDVENRGKVFVLAHPDYPDDFWTPDIAGFPDHVFDIKFEFVHEVGNKYNQIHVHGLLTIIHESRVKIEVSEMRNIINNVCAEETDGEVTRPYIHLRFLSNSVETAKRYISKGIPKRRN